MYWHFNLNEVHSCSTGVRILFSCLKVQAKDRWGCQFYPTGEFYAWLVVDIWLWPECWLRLLGGHYNSCSCMRSILLSMSSRFSNLVCPSVSKSVCACACASRKPCEHNFWVTSTSLPGFTDGDQQTELNHTLSNGGRQIALTTCRGKVGVVPPKNGSQKLLHLFGFSTTSRLNGEYLLNETWHRQSGKGVAKYVLPKFHEPWSTNGLKPGRSFYPPSLFCFVPVRRTCSMRH